MRLRDIRTTAYAIPEMIGTVTGVAEDIGTTGRQLRTAVRVATIAIAAIAALAMLALAVACKALDEALPDAR